MKYLLGIDNGGTFCKAALFDEDGNQLAVQSESSVTFSPQPGFAERDMEEMYLSNVRAIRGAVEKSGIDPKEIAGVSFSGHGKGLYLGHPYNISVSENAVIGENCNLNKGASIGVESGTIQSGQSRAPILGNRVWVGANAVLCGNIKIGDNVLIAPNAYVDTDVPPNSIVIGNILIKLY